VLDALDENYLDANRVFVACSERGEYVERRDVAIVSCGLRVDQLNWGFLKPPHASPAETAEAVRAWFEGRRLPFHLDVRGDHRERVRGLEAAGWRQERDPNPGMSLAIPGAIPAPPGRLAIEEVRTPAALVAFREAAFRGFGFPVAAARLFLDERLLGLPRVRLYAGIVDGAAVATSILVATGDVAGVYWVATAQEHRGRGYGEALTWAAVAGGRALGCKVASLQASKLGFPVYARMGFAHVLDYVLLDPPRP
jgi:hypothetical protein